MTSVSPLLKLVVLLACVAGIFFRFHGLDQKLLWHDEVYTQLFAAGTQAAHWRAEIYTGEPIPVETIQALTHNRPDRGVADTVRGLAADEPQHPPVYYILARLFVVWFGDGIVVLRTLSALLSLAVLPGGYWLCREIYFAHDSARRIAWTATALTAVSPFFVLYAQEAREYSLWAGLILCSSAALVRAMRLMGWRPWLAYILFTTLALYTSFTTASVVIAQALFVVIRSRMRVTRLSVISATAISVCGLLFAPWAWLLWRNLEAFTVSMAWSKITVIPRAELFETLVLNISRVIFDDGAIDGVTSPVLVAAVVILAASALFAVYRDARASLHAPGVYILCLFFVPVLMLLVPDVLFGGIRSISGRYLTPAWIAVECALAFLLGSGVLKLPVRRALLGVVLVAGLVSCYFNAGRAVVWTKSISTRLPEIAAPINQTASPLVVGDFERHHPGNLLALSHLLRDGARIQFLPRHGPYRLPAGFSDVFLFSPIPEFRRALEKNAGVRVVLVTRGLYAELWKVEFPN